APDDDSLARSGADVIVDTRLPGQQVAAGSTTFAHQPLAIAVPLTVSPDDLTLQQAVALITGAAADWQQLGGTARPIKLAFAGAAPLAAIGGLVGRSDLRAAPARQADASTLLAEVDGGADEAVVVPWTGPRLRSKALRIDGRLPSDAGYPLSIDSLITPQR